MSSKKSGSRASSPKPAAAAEAPNSPNKGNKNVPASPVAAVPVADEAKSSQPNTPKKDKKPKKNDVPASPAPIPVDEAKADVPAPGNKKDKKKQKAAAGGSNASTPAASPAPVQLLAGEAKESLSSLNSPAPSSNAGGDLTEEDGTPAVGGKKKEKKKKDKPDNRPANIAPKPKLSKAEQRAKQEAQRAAKAGEKAEKRGSLTNTAAPTRLQFDDPKKVARYVKKSQVTRTTSQRQVPLFSHLPQLEREISLSLQVQGGFVPDEVHPQIVRLGLKFAEGVISGSNARCLALLNALKGLIRDYIRPKDQLFGRDLLKRLDPNIRFLTDCRPLSISMGNAVSALKRKIMKLPPNIPDNQARDGLIQFTDDFIQERIEFADRLIAKAGEARIMDGMTVLTYCRSHAVELALLGAHQAGKKFHVIVVDSRPKFEGKQFAKRLVEAGVRCTYMNISGLSYVMRRVSLVFVGAHGMLSNGTAVSRVGTAMVALMANAHNVPFIICCETYKFHLRAQVDSITSNELGDPDDLISLRKFQKENILTDWRDIAKLKLLNLTYDLTPAEFVSVIITEVGEIPSTAVPVIIREYSS
jgi:translation initiation factor eIF-2B subunit delta